MTRAGITKNRLQKMGSLFGRQTLFQSLALVFCILFSLALIANTQTANDGGWYSYAVLLRSGKHLYSDLHLALQPLFVLETASFLALLGKGWLASKVPAALHVMAYCAGLMLVARSSDLPDRQKALVLACAFFVSIDFVGYRFDDYHVLADSFQLYSLVVLLALQNASEPWRRDCLAAVLGLLCGLALTTRLNDGAALFAGVAIAILFLTPARRLLALVIFSAAAWLTVVLVVHSTGDSLGDWAAYSIFKAAGSKGGTHNILTYPLQLPWKAMLFLNNRQRIEFLIYCLGLIFLWVALVRRLWRKREVADCIKLFAAAIFTLLSLRLLRGALMDSSLIVVLSAVGVLLVYAGVLTVCVRLLCWLFAPGKYSWDPREILLLIPFGQLASASMSSGGEHIGLYAPLAMMILLLPIASPITLRSPMARAFGFAVLIVLAVHCASYKYRYPYFWHSYKAGPLFIGRQWYTHPEYGPMVIETQELNFIQPICDAVKLDGAKEGLLSLPFSYPNYFCAIDPWHGYVQTFFDTTSKQTIDRLISELGTAPPKWIVYQRQLNNLKLHEQIFNQGKPLPHRYLDQLIEAKIASGEWQTVYTSTFGSYDFYSDEWLLIRTRQ